MHRWQHQLPMHDVMDSLQQADGMYGKYGGTMQFENKQYWGVILGASSGFGLATAKKLASQGMNICAIHRDRRGSMKRIEEDFDAIRAFGVKFLSVNTNALDPGIRQDVLNMLQENMGEGEKVRMLLHSIAFGNLKLLAPCPDKGGQRSARALLAEKLGISADKLEAAIQDLFSVGVSRLHPLADPPLYNQERLASEEDFSNTIYAMGTSLLGWVQDIFSRNIFASDARVFGLTSEGNSIAWQGYAPVSAAKAVLESVSRSLAVEMAPYGIRSNIIQAGVTDTPALRHIPGHAHIASSAMLRNPFKRLTRPEDVANVIALLCTEEAAWINGDIIRVDGGEHVAG
ncbi:SDR family oxidoreductase [Fidelibacter multiformis]|uniref:SDR family oxidoreductase n=1 Tax=Fidelibacter multiformis TaxID=3377529 RepID=UPI0037DDADF5